MSRRKFDRYMIRLDIGAHPKLAGLTDSEFRAHIAGVLAVAAASPERGCLLIGQTPAQPRHIARAAGVSVRVAAAAIAKLESVGVLQTDDRFGCLRVHDWDDVNPAPKADRTNAERQRRFRNARNNAVTNGDVTPTEVKKEEERSLGSKGNRSSSSSSTPAAVDVKATDDDRRLCRLLAELATERNPKFKVKSSSRWLTDMRLLRERDGNAPDEIERAVRWVFRDDFWGGVIQSPGNLREHFPTIWDRLTRPQKPGSGPVEDSAAFLARRGAA